MWLVGYCKDRPFRGMDGSWCGEQLRSDLGFGKPDEDRRSDLGPGCDPQRSVDLVLRDVRTSTAVDLVVCFWAILSSILGLFVVDRELLLLLPTRGGLSSFLVARL